MAKTNVKRVEDAEVEIVEESINEDAMEIIDEQSIPMEEAMIDTSTYDGNTLLFPEGPTLNKVEEWRSLYGQVYATEFDDEIFIWRTLKRVEYKEILKIKGADALFREERICQKCVVWPENYDFVDMASGKAGTPSILTEQIMDKSGFSASEPIQL